MGGKAAILLVLGFSLIFLVAGNNFNRVASTSVDNFSDYYTQTNAYNIARSAANIAANKVFFDQTWTAGFSNVSFADGKMSASVQIINVIQNIRKITASATYQGITKTIEVTLQPSKFSKFAYYSANEPSTIWWTTKDTVWGPMHVQGTLQVAGRPVFNGKVTTQNGLTMFDPGHWKTIQVKIGKKWVNQKVWVPGADDPQFNGGYETGVNLPLPANGVADLEAASDAGGKKFTGQDTVFIKFQGDSVKYKYKKNNNYVAALGSTFAPNGVIFAKDAVLRVEGTVKGQYSLGVSGSTSAKGKVFLDDDIVYNTNPRTNPGSTDLLGIISQYDVMITDNVANRTNINIDASIYSQQGGFGADNYSSRGVSGIINLYGGITQSVRRAVGTFSGSTITSGFSKRYRYDDRLALISPPYYPGTGAFQIVSWYE
ncbi:MAG: hypothetical protein CVV24_07910 [Ignavibacteriae bacterium HGW-Ignavibacteriae-3]|nr:MAG: hypothetical protein CVV24_07910 [Ignavibacteriae bacterium HGW-Ignavibacteriae-3]